MAGPGRILILSDTHLATPGRGAASAEALRPLWQGMAELIINGDVAEIADVKVRGAAARQIVRLHELTEADGVKLTLISGNHDPLLTDRRYLRLADREVFLTHGDILHPAISPWTDHAKQLRGFHADAVMSLDPSKARQIDAQLAACQHASVVQWEHEAHPLHEKPSTKQRTSIQKLKKKARHAEKIAKALYYWHTIPKRAIGFARRFAPESRYFIFGHIHRAGVWIDREPGGEIDRRVIINTGAFQTPRCPRGVVLEGMELSIWPIQYNRDGHRFMPEPIATFPLNSPAIAAQRDPIDLRDLAVA
jgi:UDP-2,3-diacylglucosamine pyrophosphatase LpxH